MTSGLCLIFQDSDPSRDFSFISILFDGRDLFVSFCIYCCIVRYGGIQGIIQATAGTSSYWTFQGSIQGSRAATSITP